MKNLLVILLTFISFNSFSQDSYQVIDFVSTPTYQPKKLSLSLNTRESSTGPSIGVGMILGGGVFVLAGALTQPDYVGGSTTEKKPLYSQPKFYTIITGSAIMFVGITISL